MFHTIVNAIEEFDTIIIHRHSRPDGDAMGSQLGLKFLLQENYPEKKVYAVGDDPRAFAFMEGSTMDEIPDSTYENALAIILDSGAPHLISDDRYKLAAKTARIDHHLFVAPIADVEVIDSSFESCCGEIAEMAREAGWKLSRLSAQSIYTGMVTDSGRFRYDATSPRTLRLAAMLLETGFDTNALYRQLYAETLESKQRKAQFILKVKFTKHKVAYIYTTKEEFEALQMDTFAVSRGMVNTMADLQGVSIWVNFTEADEGVLCELRSNAYNINPIAVKYGGGGHQKASGACVKDYDTAMAMLQDLDNMIGENQ